MPNYPLAQIDGVDSGGRNVVDLNALPPVITTTRMADIGAQLVANVLPAYGYKLQSLYGLSFILFDQFLSMFYVKPNRFYIF